jgi:GcrA cell cycle regulator
VSDFTWTEERIAELRRLWDQGLAGSAIARQLGTSKSAVVGKAHRLGLSGRPSPIRRGPRRMTTARAVRRERVAAVIDRPVAGQQPAERGAGSLPAGRAVLAQRRLAGALPAPKTCQWIDRDDGPFGDADKCGQPSAHGKPYCADHWRRAWRRVGTVEP